MQILSVSEEDALKVGVFMSIAALPSYQITLNFHHLCKINLYSFSGVEVVFEIEAPSDKGESAAAQQKPLLLLPHLEDLKLESMNTLTHVWKCSNWNAFFTYPIHQPQSSSLQNLTTITLYSCNSIKYLFSPLMGKLLSNLKELDIRKCWGMEEVVSSRDDEDEEMIPQHTTTTMFPHLDLLRLYSTDNLRRIGGGKSKLSHVDAISWTLSQYSREIDVQECATLSSVIPCYTTGRMQKIQMLRVINCRSMIEVFETKEVNSSSVAVAIPRPTDTTMCKFPNLKTLYIFGCDLLEYVFTFPTLESLKNLETLEIVKCKAMKVIVKEEVLEDTSASSKEIVLPNLKSIELYELPNLEGFYLGVNVDFQWPLLDKAEIKHCPQMMAFTSGRLIAPRLKYIQTELGKYSFEGVQVTPMLHQTQPPSLDGSHATSSKRRAWSFHNLVECNLAGSSFKDTKVFPSSELQKLQKLEKVHVGMCDNVEEVFEVALEETNNESQTVVTFPKLTEVRLERTYYLRSIWKSNPYKKLEFPNLTRLSLDYCRRLEHVFTSSMVGCVMQLQELRIQECENMKVIVKEEEEDSDCKASEIVFPRLKSLILDRLKSLEGFSLGKEDFTFPSLDTLVIDCCPEVTVFTRGCSVAPELATLNTSFGSFNVIGQDLNFFIRKKIQEGYRFEMIEREYSSSGESDWEDEY